MSEPKAKVRTTRWGDRKTFLQLWRPFMEEQHAEGSMVRPSDHNLRQYCQLFESYTVGSLFGFGVLAFVDERPVGVGLFGEDTGAINLETDFGKAGTAWGQYVDPSYRKKGIGHQMLTYCYREAMAMGFQCVITSVLLNSEAARANALNYPGVQAYSTVVYSRLSEVPVL